MNKTKAYSKSFEEVINAEIIIMKFQQKTLTNIIENLTKIKLKSKYDENRQQTIDYWTKRKLTYFKSMRNNYLFKVNTFVSCKGIIYGTIENGNENINDLSHLNDMSHIYTNKKKHIVNLFELTWFDKIKKIVHDYDNHKWLLSNDKVILISTNDSILENLNQKYNFPKKNTTQLLLAGNDYYFKKKLMLTEKGYDC